MTYSSIDLTKKVYDYVVDDYGRTVLALGDEGSVKRIGVLYPRLLDRLNSLYFSAYDSPGRAVDEAIELIRQAGISDEELTRRLLLASAYGDEPDGSVTKSLVLRV